MQYTRALRVKIESKLSSQHLMAGSPSAEVKALLQDPSKLLKRFRLSYNTALQKDHCIQVGPVSGLGFGVEGLGALQNDDCSQVDLVSGLSLGV